MIILVCGYRRTGKDSFYNKLSSSDSDCNFEWEVYVHPDKAHLYQNKSDCFGSGPYQRFSFADRLKEEASPVYGIPVSVPEEEKDVKQFVHYQTGHAVSARDIWIEWGAIRRAQDKDYWCKLINPSADVCTIVTDWRFPNEGQFIKDQHDAETRTVRLYRSGVAIPEASIESERALDQYETDFLLVPVGDILHALSHFPQYFTYEYLGTV